MKLSELKNIGREMERKLQSVGINSAEELKDAGSKDAFSLLKRAYPEVCLVHLYTLQGAVDGIDFNRLSESVKQELKAFNEQLK